MQVALAGFAATSWSTWIVAGIATAGVILRPFAWPEFIWAVAGSGALVMLGLLPWREALHGVARGTDVYLFLVGMMLLAEVARLEGLFDWLAAKAARLAEGSAPRLFALIFGVGTLVTVFLSNDATAVVLTPAVAAVIRAVEAKRPLPYLLICAFIANAASFVLPISNPANLVIYGSQMPPLLRWLSFYTLPSAFAIGATFAVLRWTQRTQLRETLVAAVTVPVLSAGGMMAATGIGLTAIALLAASAADWSLGLSTFLAGIATLFLVRIRARIGLFALVRDIPWGVIPLVAGLFVLVQALDRTGVTGELAKLVAALVQRSEVEAAWLIGLTLGFGCNLMNNLPAGLLAGRVVELAQVPESVRAAVLISVDVGPNLSVTGSLATILWLTALRREGLHVGAWQFLKLGALVMPPALVLAIGGMLLVR
ncbi:arsenic transporter [Rhodopila sp.]|jgi:arsenical pump membrane protein|uniref:arsenic transporter n=1 Tax=Rhodopila sp. TaxID=2480087 RepID=UPI002BC23657|nr:arsenic transporter [Rhodopila sp.]HVZ10440.1 arsenic transporter [Rhodopila sp.]